MQLVGTARRVAWAISCRGEAETCWQPRGKDGRAPSRCGGGSGGDLAHPESKAHHGDEENLQTLELQQALGDFEGRDEQRKAQKEDFLSDRWCEVNHLCVSKKCVTPDTFPLLQITSAAGTFSQRCSSGLSHSLHPKSPSPCPRQLQDRNQTQGLQAELQQHSQDSL